MRTNWSASTPHLVCPVCGDNYVHPVEIVCLPPGGSGRGVLRVDADGVHLNPAVEPMTRGVVIILRFVCEQGHQFTFGFEFHEGQTYTTATAGQRVDARRIRTIWRD